MISRRSGTILSMPGIDSSAGGPPDRGVYAYGLVKRYGSFSALDGLDLAVPEGTVGGVLGPNGAGKTTTIRILSTLVGADGGAAWVGGYEASTDPHSVRSVISLTGQFAAVDGDLTGFQNLVMIGRLCRLGRLAAKARATELLDRFALSDAAGRLVRSYSGGMRRRLDLAASLVSSPAVVFLDEPTTGLDPPSREQLWNVVNELREQGTTIVLTTQYLEEADRLADYITVVDHGRAVAKGTPAQLKAEVGGDVIELHSSDRPVAERAARLLADRLGVDSSSIDLTDEGPVQLRIAFGALTVVEAVRLLDGEGHRMDDIRLRRASLDEVFSTITRPQSVAN